MLKGISNGPPRRGKVQMAKGILPFAFCDLNFLFRVRYPIPNSSTFSSGVPHLRQMTAPQSPHTSGS
jgi:hypothetical protein